MAARERIRPSPTGLSNGTGPFVFSRIPHFFINQINETENFID
jgi:hypothetical protein